MPLTAEDVVERVFKQEFRGYDREEVDTFLDDVADRIAELTKEAEDGHGEVARAPEPPPPAAVEEQPTEVVREPPPPPAVEVEVEGGEGFEALLKRTLLAAQRTADQTVEEAERTARETVEAARAQADRVLTDARRQSDATREDAERWTEEYVGDVRRRVEAEREESEAGARRIRDAVQELEEFRREYTARVREVITAQLEQLDREEDLPDLPPRVGELDRVAREEQGRLAQPSGARAHGGDAGLSAPPRGPAPSGPGPTVDAGAAADDDADTDQMEAAEIVRAGATRSSGTGVTARDDEQAEWGPAVGAEPGEPDLAEAGDDAAPAPGPRPADLSGAPRGPGGAPRPRVRGGREGRPRIRDPRDDAPRPAATSDPEQGDRPPGGA